MRQDLLPVTYRKKLARVVEECGEFLKAKGKLERFGTTAIDPKTGIEYDNVAKMNLELDHLLDAIRRFKSHSDPVD
jgi:hypothetical protein